MTPHEVIKKSVEEFDIYFEGNIYKSVPTDMDVKINKVKEYLKSSQLSLLLSVKEMMESKKKNNVFVPYHTPSVYGGLVCLTCGGQEDCECESYNEALSDLQSLLDSEINKIKEI